MGTQSQSQSQSRDVRTQMSNARVFAVTTWKSRANCCAIAIALVTLRTCHAKDMRVRPTRG
eukprot:12980221-Alexandrium_andersonii.AAC.1